MARLRKQSSSYVFSETDRHKCRHTHRPPLRHNEHLDLELEAHKYTTNTYSPTHMLLHSGRQTHAVIQSPL
jgi:hypothetical protein